MISEQPDPDVVEALSLIRAALQNLTVVIAQVSPEDERLHAANRSVDELDRLVTGMELTQRSTNDE